MYKVERQRTRGKRRGVNCTYQLELAASFGVLPPLLFALCQASGFLLLFVCFFQIVLK